MFVPVKNNFAVLLEKKQRIEDRFIPLSEIATKTGISRKTLYKWEKDQVTQFDTKVVDALCEYFGVELSELLSHMPPEPKKKTAPK